MLLKLQFKKSVVSSWILFIFILTLVVGASISDFFQAPAFTSHEFNRYHLLFNKNDLGSVDKIVLKNKLGTFHIAQNDKSSNSNRPWNLVFPRKLPANASLINEIINSFRDVKIRKVFLQDPINITNFSLDKPPIEISFRSKSKKVGDESRVVKLYIGLANPIDNSTYVMLSNKEAIYHVDGLKYSLETLNLTDFVDSRIFTMGNPSNFSTVKLYKNRPRNSSKVQLDIKNVNNIWLENNERELDEKKVNEYLSGLTSLKGNLILDKRDEALDKALARYLKSPLYTLQVKYKNDDEMITYLVSSIVNNLPGIKVEKRQTFIISASNRPHPYVLNKQFLNLFNKNIKALRKISFKKLFY